MRSCSLDSVKIHHVTGDATKLTANIFGVRVIQARFSVAVASTPGIESIVVFTIMARLDILTQIAAVLWINNWSALGVLSRI